ncbi:Tetratricopeptide repeat protein 8-like [Homarus americanus]|uniref:Tetratricopeptide repeat protein 8-like n=1 Tax=Homarus americanus TaxID=6706 RepID=A0A8J5KE68_HOMAM|nr:Tetratricopeptide repeat protein 8-like [Homarus americanus]
MDPLFLALSNFKRRNFEKCIEICTEKLNKNPYDQAMWSLKTRALTEQVWVDDCDGEEEGLADVLMDDNTIASVARPGTSLRAAPPSSSDGPSQTFRPSTQSGRPLSGVVRPGSQGGRPGTMDQALRTPRTAQTARPVSATSGRHVRLGTASMLSTADGPFINLARLNVAKYASQQSIAKALFEYIYFHENNVRQALDLAAQATQSQDFKDWWWKVQLGRCYYRLGLFRDAEKQFKSALKQQDNINTYLLLGRVYIRLDQPMAALEVYKGGLDKFHGEVTLLTAISRIYEGLHDLTKAVKFYKDVLHFDATHVEAIACIGTHHFYTDQPEQYDMTLTCFERALSLATNQSVADVWYNLGHIALGIGDINLAYQCYRLALVADNDHGESYNNLGVLEYRRGNLDTSRAFFMTAASLSPHMFQPHYNHAKLSHKVGDLQTSYIIVQKALSLFPAHVDSKELLKTLETHFQTL